MAKGRDLEDLLAAVNAASAKARITWIAMLSFGSYLAVAVGATTHRDLFLESPVSLPILGVDLPLIAFYVVAPFLFLIMHLYLLVNLYVLGRRIHLFEGQMSCQVPEPDGQERVRARLDPFIVLLHVAGRMRALVPRLLLALTVWVTVIAGPLVLLIAFQVQFLAYHSQVVTWVHRGLVFADIVFLWALWPSTIHDSGRFWPAVWSFFWAIRRFVRQVIELVRRVSLSTQRAAAAPLAVFGLFITTGFVAVFSLLVATIPDEWAEERIRSSGWFELTERDGRTMWWPTAALFQGELDEARARLDSIFSRSLVLPDADLISMSEEELGKVERTLTMRARDLRYANLIGADLRKVEFIVPDLRHARLDDAKLTGARFACAARAGRVSPGPDDCPQLQGAWLDGAQLQGAWLDGAQLQGASLDRAQLHGAWLNGAQLQGASLDRAQLQGASLVWAELRGASLGSAQLQGASLFLAQLQGASLDGAGLWRANVSKANTTLLSCINSDFDPLTMENLDELDAVMNTIPDGEWWQGAKDRLPELRAPAEAFDESALKAAWNDTACSQYDPQQSDGELANFLVSDVVCTPSMIFEGTAVGAISVLHRILLRRLGPSEPRDYPGLVARAVSEDDQCKAVREALPEWAIAEFRSLLDEAEPAAPVPASPLDRPAKPKPSL